MRGDVKVDEEESGGRAWSRQSDRSNGKPVFQYMLELRGH